MKQLLNRRRFVGLLGTAGVVGTAGCLGDDDDGDNTVPEGGDGGSGNQQSVATDDFDFPPGADDRGIVTERVISGALNALASTDRYRISQDCSLEYGGDQSDEAELSYEVDDETVLERRLQNGTEIERMITPDRTFCRAAEVDGDRSGQWMTDSEEVDAADVDDPHVYPFEKTTVAALLDNPSFDFDGVVTKDDQSYAQYTADIVHRDQNVLQWWIGAKVSHDLISPLEGSVSVLLAENGAIHAVDYDLDGEIARMTRDSTETRAARLTGEIRLAYDNLGEFTAPEWFETGEAADFREFAVEDGSLGHAYRLKQGPAVPGTMELVYAEFYVTAQIDGERHVGRFSKPTDFTVGDRLFVGIENDEFVLSRFSISGQNALVEADWLEMSIHLYDPTKRSRILVHHERFYP